jgi:hypothetical protein
VRSRSTQSCKPNSSCVLSYHDNFNIYDTPHFPPLYRMMSKLFTTSTYKMDHQSTTWQSCSPTNKTPIAPTHTSLHEKEYCTGFNNSFAACQTPQYHARNLLMNCPGKANKQDDDLGIHLLAMALLTPKDVSQSSKTPSNCQMHCQKGDPARPSPAHPAQAYKRIATIWVLHIQPTSPSRAPAARLFSKCGITYEHVIISPTQASPGQPPSLDHT